ncbi:acylphosphatase-2 isoform 1-T1 [Passerculus sandwichensis]
MFPLAAVGRSLLTLGALFGAPWPAPFSREAAACAVSLSLSRSRPGAACSQSSGGCHSGSSFAAAMSAPAKVSGALKSVDYEVFGRVQGVCFRMVRQSWICWLLNGIMFPVLKIRQQYTEQEAKKLGVVGWVKNTSQGTVTGQVQGPEERVNEMKSWLSKVGSPSSRIDKTNFSNEKEISKLDFSDFNTRY